MSNVSSGQWMLPDAKLAKFHAVTFLYETPKTTRTRRVCVCVSMRVCVYWKCIRVLSHFCAKCRTANSEAKEKKFFWTFLIGNFNHFNN